MIDFSDVIEKTENENLNAEANARLYSDGATKPLDFSGASATAQAVIESEHPAQSGIKWEELSRVEQVANSLEGGYHGLVKGGVADDALRYQAWSSIGFSGLTGDIDEDIDDESRAAIEKLLNKDTLANREFKQKAFVKAMDSVKEYRELERKDSLFATPIGMKNAVDAAEGKGFVDGTAAALGEVFSGDVLGNMIYLAGSSFGAMAPYVVQTAALGGVSSLNAVRAMGATNRVRSALAGASMGMGEHSMESGAYLLEEMNKRGLDPKDIESYRKLFESDYDEFQRNRSARSTVVSAFGALSGVSLVTKFNPRESYRKMMTALRDAQSSRDLMVKKGFAKPTVTTTPATRASVFGDEMLNIGTQSLIQGTLGGAGEYLGTKATGEDPNMAEVLFEFLGEFTSAPVEVASLSATTINGYRNDAVMANTAKVGQNVLTKMTQATEAVANQIKDNESLQQWAERVGEDRSLLAFGQDLVDNGQVEEIRKVDPELAEKIDKAAEEKQTVEVPVSKVVGIAAQNRKLADDIIYDSRVSIDGMTPRQADDFEKNGRVEAEKKLDDILAKTRISKEHAKEASEVSKEITDALVQDGMSQQYASMAGRVWESYLVQRSRLLGVSPREIANAMNWRVHKENGLRDQAEAAKGALVEQPEGVDADIELPQTVQIDGQKVSAVDSEGNYVGRNAEEVTSFYRWFNGKGDDERGMGQTLANRDVSGETSSSEFSFAREWTDDERKKGYRDGDKRIGIDSKGRPRVFYHGTTALFDTVQLGHKGQLDSGYMGRGFYLTSNPKQAETYIYRKKLSGVEDSVGEFNMAMYAKALNPVEISRELYGEMHAANSEMMPIASDHLRKKFIEAGYDSAYIVQYDGGKPFIELVVFEPSQVKAARSMQDERGRPNTSYDPNDDNMFHQPVSSHYPTAVRKVEDGEFDYTTDSDIDEFFDRAIALRNEGVQGAWAQKTGQVRGTYSPRSAAGISSNTAGLITLMEAADKSTFMHESAHAWLDADTYLAQALVKKHRSGQQLTAGEEAFLKNFGAFLRWGQDEKVLSLGVGEDLDSICDGLEAWANMTVNEQRNMHELFAEGFESYLMGGEAPNTQLIEMFKQFAQWLKEVYAKMTSRPRPLSPEIRKLYDQLFVSEQEAADAEARAGLTKMFSDLDTDLMSDAERAEYDRLCYEANQETQSVIARSLSSAMRLYANVREGTRALLMRLHKDRVAMVQDRLNKEPRYIAYMMLTTGYKQKGSDNAISTKLSRQGMKDAGFDKKTIALLKRRQLVDEVGVTPEVLASMCGHSNPLTLIGELLEIRGLDNEACNIVAAQVKEETGLGVEAYSELRADLAAHNATRSRVLTAEHNIIARKLGKRQLLIGAAREYAIEKIGAMKMADIRPYVYHRDEKRCAREAEVAFRKGDFERCLEMKRAQILNHELARAAMEVQDKYEKGQRRVKRAMKSKTIYPAYQQLLSYIAKQHGMDYRSNVKDIDEQTALKIAASLESDGTPVDGVTPSADSLPIALIEKDLDAMTADEVNVLFDALRQLETLGRARLTIVKDGIKAKVSELIEEGVGTLEANAQEQGRTSKVERIPLTRKEKAFDTLQRFFYAHIKIATWCRIFDGNKSGFFTRMFIQTANERAGWEEDQRVKVAERVRDIMRPVFKNNRMFEDDKVRIGIRMMSKGERIAAALNMGNESNFQRLVDGDRAQWTAEAVQDLQESLTADDWRAVQMIWDLFESYRPLIAEKEQRVYGVEPEWIDIKEIEVLSKGGQKIKLKGGYYPVVYDPRASNIADVHQDVAAIEQSMKGAWQSATTRRSFTKSRVSEVHDRPLRLDLSALYSGLDDVIHDLAWHEWLIDTHRLLQGVSSDGGLRESIKEYYGYHVAKAFEEWRQAIALGDRAEMDGTTRKIFHWAGGNVGLTAMGYSFTSALAQLTGIGYIVPRCGTVHTIAALKDYLKNPKNIRKAINAKSTLMRNRHISATKQVSDIRNVLERGKENWLTKYAYSMLLAVQSMVDAITWQAGYRKALSEGKSEEAAMQEADQIVIDTQSSGRVNDLAAIERNEYLAPFTVFYSWANAALNQSFAVAQSETSKPKKLAQLFYMGVIMPVIDGLFRECMKIDGDDDDDDEEKDWFDYMLLMPAAKSIEYHCGLLVGVREVANAAGSVVSGDMVWKYGGPAGVRGISTVVDLGNAIQDPVSWSSFNTFVDLTGLAGLPSTQIKKTVKGFRAIESGQVEGFDAMLAPFLGFSGKIEE